MSATRTDADDRTDRRSDRIVRSAPTEHRFRAATVDEALAQVRASLGEDVEIVEANRIRRGGIGGFFATELGVEVVARTNGADDRADVFEPFEPLDEASFTAAATPPTVKPAVKQAVTPAVKPAPRAWTVDNGIGAHVVADPSMPAARARQAWREATRGSDAEAEGPARLPGFDAPSDQGAVEDEAQEPVAGPQPTTFAEHFLRELVQDAEQLRRSSDRNRVLPIRGAADDGTSMPMGRPEPLAGTPVARVVPAPAPTPTAAPTVAEEPPTLPGMPAPTPKRRAKRSGTGRTKSTAERRVEAEAAAAAAVAAEAAVAAASAAPAHAVIGGLIDQCVALTTSADDAAAPSKIALAVTLPDGSVMKVSIERPRRVGRSVRDAAGA